tara:strand:- start:1225 stop:1506 length:282 start_codon:yes stop_codon:yes gene_type:complete
MKTYYAYKHVEYDTYLDPEFAYEPFSMTYYNVDELINAGQGTSTSLDQVALELLILEGILPEDYYESDNDDDYLEEEQVAALIKEHSIEIIVV